MNRKYEMKLKALKALRNLYDKKLIKKKEYKKEKKFIKNI